MANATAVEAAISDYWSDVDYEDRMVAITCFAFENDEVVEGGWVAGQLRDFNGVLVDGSCPHNLAVFPRMVDAIGFAARLREHLNGGCRIGINLAEFETTPEGLPGAGSNLAKRLMKQSEPGGMTVSAVAGQRITSRLLGGEDGGAIAGGWRGYLYAGLQWGGLLGYFAAWSYAIYWMISYHTIHGTYPCMPDWLCG